MYVDFTFIESEDTIKDFIDKVIDFIEEHKDEVKEDLAVTVDIVYETIEGDYDNFEFKEHMSEESDDEFEMLCDNVADRLRAELRRRM